MGYQELNIHDIDMKYTNVLRLKIPLNGKQVDVKVMPLSTSCVGKQFGRRSTSLWSYPQQRTHHIKSPRNEKFI